MIRVEWTAPHGLTGCGIWHDESQRAVVQAWADDANTRLPGWNHRVVTSSDSASGSTVSGEPRG